MTREEEDSLELELARLSQAEREELEAASALLAVRDDLEFRPDQLARGRLRLDADLRVAEAREAERRSSRPRYWRWLRITPLPLALAGILFVALRRAPNRTESHADVATLPPPTEALVLAQSRALEARLAASAANERERALDTKPSGAAVRAQEDLDRELRAYRATLLARLEDSGP